MEKRKRIIYLVSTGIISAMMLLSAVMYFVRYEEVAEVFLRLGYPVYIIYPLAIAKILAIVAIWTRKSETLKEWAYAGLFFDYILAASGHIVANDGEFMPALFAMVVLLISYWAGGKEAIGGQE